jgi:hypothetical protein
MTVAWKVLHESTWKFAQYLRTVMYICIDNFKKLIQSLQCLKCSHTLEFGPILADSTIPYLILDSTHFGGHISGARRIL